jgi:hypothetical protein
VLKLSGNMKILSIEQGKAQKRMGKFMGRIRPKLQNKIEIPVNIFRGEELIVECPSIQEAARFFKKGNRS